jgi:hypothetical protein
MTTASRDARSLLQVKLGLVGIPGVFETTLPTLLIVHSVIECNVRRLRLEGLANAC